MHRTFKGSMRAWNCFVKGRLPNSNFRFTTWTRPLTHGAGHETLGVTTTRASLTCNSPFSTLPSKIPQILRGTPLDIPNQMAHEFFFERMQKFGEETCIVDMRDNTSYTFNEVLSLSSNISVGLQKLGMRQGDIILFYKNNSADFVTMMLGVSAAGGVVTPINPASTAYELQKYLSLVKPKFIFTEEALLPAMKEATQALRWEATFIMENITDDCSVSVKSLVERGQANSRSEVFIKDLDPKTSPVLIMFSSGTTGFPKGVMLSHRGLVSGQRIQARLFPPNHMNLIVFPQFHAGGLICNTMRSLAYGITQVMYPKFDFVQLLEGIQTFKPNVVTLPPPLLVLMAKSPLVDQYDLSSIRYVISGGAAIKADVENEFKQRLHDPIMLQGYGMTETAALCITKDYKDGHIKPGSVGTAADGIEAKIVNRETGELLGPNEHGEIVYRTPSVMLGYLNDPEATKIILDDDGWIHTGDMGYYDQDGYFFVVDRYKELIKYKGFQVSPAELDDVLLTHPDVADAAVIGVPDREAGELPRAYVVKKPGTDTTEQEVAAFIAERVSYFKQLRGGVHFVETIPKLPSGKILRRVIREKALEECNGVAK